MVTGCTGLKQASDTCAYPRKIEVITCPSKWRGSEVITLHRTDTTLDLSQKAEKGMTVGCELRRQDAHVALTQYRRWWDARPPASVAVPCCRAPTGGSAQHAQQPTSRAASHGC